ncbi:MAG TPA: urate hydroxylase PuuD [Polyangiaceae bacterium]
MALFSLDGGQFLARWLHFLAGVTWIGLLYYFNFVQGSWFKEAEASVKGAAVQQLVPRALWWFRWGAMFTFLSGVFIIGIKGHQTGSLGVAFETPWGAFIFTGALLGTLMFLNVWLIIWPNQKIVIADAKGEKNPKAAAAGAKALLASRTNTLFSIPMLFFMGAASHLNQAVRLNGALLGAVFGIAAVLEGNALFGKLGPLTSVKGVITCGFVLAAVLYGLVSALG